MVLKAMKPVHTVIVTVVTTISLLGLAFFIYETNDTLQNYKREVFGMRASYAKLKLEYDNLLARTKSLRQTTIVTNQQNSKNIEIAKIIDLYAKKVNGDLSIYFKNLTTNESVIVDANTKYYMASIYKVILTLFLLDEVAKGNTTFDAKVGTSSATLAVALNQIITESNNEYAQELAESYGWITIEKAMSQKLGISFSFDKGLTTSVKDIGLLFEDIALSLRIEAGESNYLLRLLGDQQSTQKFPKYLPKNVLSHNKTGEYNDYSHDAGIFYTPKTNYVLVFMSKTKDPADTNETMAKMSKDIYETLNK